MNKNKPFHICSEGKQLQKPLCLGLSQITFHILNGGSLTYLRNLMRLPDVWMKITMTGRDVPITS